jgi:hypothetical protein
MSCTDSSTRRGVGMYSAAKITDKNLKIFPPCYSQSQLLYTVKKKGEKPYPFLFGLIRVKPSSPLDAVGVKYFTHSQIIPPILWKKWKKLTWKN